MKGRIPFLTDIKDQVRFSINYITLLEAHQLRYEGWEMIVKQVKDDHALLWQDINSGVIDVACWDDPISVGEHREMILSLTGLEYEQLIRGCI